MVGVLGTTGMVTGEEVEIFLVGGCRGDLGRTGGAEVDVMVMTRDLGLQHKSMQDHARVSGGVCVQECQGSPLRWRAMGSVGTTGVRLN